MDNIENKDLKKKGPFKFALPLILLLVVGIIGFGVYEYFRIAPRDVRFTNVTSSSVTVSWNTKAPTSATALAFKGDTLLPLTVLGLGGERFYDTRDVKVAELDAKYMTSQKIADGDFVLTEDDLQTEVVVEEMGEYYTHHVTITGLDPETEYSFMVGDRNLYRKVKDINDNVTVKSLEVPEEIKTPSPAYGSVLDAENQADLPLDELMRVSDGVIYFNYLEETTGSRSNLFSSALSESGNWYVDVSAAVDKNGDQFFKTYQGPAYEFMIELTLDAGPLGIWEKKEFNGANSPVPPIIINYPTEIEGESSLNKIKSFLNPFVQKAFAYTNTVPAGVTCEGEAVFDGYCGPCVKKCSDGRYYGGFDCPQSTLCSRGCATCGGEEEQEEQEKEISCGGSPLGTVSIYISECKICQKEEQNGYWVGKWVTTTKYDPTKNCAPIETCDVKDCEELSGGKYKEEGVCDTEEGRYTCVRITYRNCGVERQCYNRTLVESQVQNKALCYERILANDGITWTCTDKKVEIPGITACSEDEFAYDIKRECLDDAEDKNNEESESADEEYVPCYYMSNASPNGGWFCNELSKIYTKSYCLNGKEGPFSSLALCEDAAKDKNEAEAELTSYDVGPAADYSDEACWKGISRGYYRYIDRNGKYVLQRCKNDGTWKDEPTTAGSQRCADLYALDGSDNVNCENKRDFCTIPLDGEMVDYFCDGKHWVKWEEYKGQNDEQELPAGPAVSIGYNEPCSSDRCICPSNQIISEREICVETSSFCDNVHTEGKVCHESGRTCQVPSNMLSRTFETKDEARKFYVNGGEGKVCVRSTFYCYVRLNKNNQLVPPTILDFDVYPFKCLPPQAIASNPEPKLIKGAFSQESLESTTEFIIDPQTGMVSNIELGSYLIEYEGEYYTFAYKDYDLENGDGSVMVYLDKNNNGEYDEGTDQKISDIASEISVITLEKEYTYNLREGLNFVSFPFLPSVEAARTAVGLLGILNQVYDNNIYSISKFDGGRWNMVGQNDKLYGNNDFQLLPGVGYVIKVKEDIEITILGRPVKYESVGDNAPVTLFEGWNLIGIYGTGVKTYTAKTMIADINAANFTADNVSKWAKEKQSYEGFQFSEEQEYGFDFPINTLESVFVRVLEGRGNWQPKLGSQ